MDSTDLAYWLVNAPDIYTIYNATNTNGDAYNMVVVPLTQNDVVTTYGNNLGYKGSYVNYYIANDVVLVPTYNDPNDAVAISIIQGIYPSRTVVGIDVRNLYEYGGMIHCITQQQPVALNSTGLLQPSNIPFQLLQNNPNPFNQLTTIGFSIDSHSSVILTIYNTLGQIVSTLTSITGEQNIVLNAADFESGIYLYTLTVNDQVVGSKKMIINK